MAVQFDRLKQVDHRTRDLVTGFIRIIGIQCDEERIIPSLVATLCILFYHLGEMFSVYGDSMATNDTSTRLSIYRPSVSRETAYGNILIDNKCKCIYRWDIKISHFLITRFDTYFGIDASNKRHTDSGFYNRVETMYAFSQSALKTSCDHWDVFKPFGKRMKEGDVVRMEINTNDRTMRVYLNGEELGIAHENILFENKQYYLAVSLCSNTLGRANAVELLNFEIVKID